MKSGFRTGSPPTLRWEKGLPRLVLSARWERPLRWIIRLLGVTGILIALLGLQPLPGVAVAIGLVAADWFLEHSIFRFVAIHVTPLPDFEYDPAQWTSMAYLFEGQPPAGTPIGIGFVFRDAEYAKKFFELLRAWNFGDTEDRNDNITFSAIIDEERYWIYLYPSFHRRPVRSSWRRVRGRAWRAGKAREPLLLIMTMVICHEFSTMQGYSLGHLADRYRDGQPVQLIPFLDRPGQEPARVNEVRPITKFRLKIKARADLEADEFEAVHLRRLGQ